MNMEAADLQDQQGLPRMDLLRSSSKTMDSTMGALEEDRLLDPVGVHPIGEDVEVFVGAHHPGL